MALTTDPTAAPKPVVVVKLGGDVLVGEPLARVANGVREATADGYRLAVVHGGGAQVTALSEKLGLRTTMISGRRVTDAATIDVLTMVLAGKLNVELCLALRATGLQPVGLHAGSGTLTARKRPPAPLTGAGPEPVDLGLVGDVTGFDLALLETLWAAGRVPVLSCLGVDDERHTVLNVNGDLAASQLAAALRAHALLAVTGVGGVRRDRNDPGSRIARLSVAQARSEIAEGRVQGGMIAKLEEAFVPLAAGVASVHIVAPNEIAATLRAPGSVGTLLVS